MLAFYRVFRYFEMKEVGYFLNQKNIIICWLSLTLVRITHRNFRLSLIKMSSGMC